MRPLYSNTCMLLTPLTSPFKNVSHTPSFILTCSNSNSLIPNLSSLSLKDYTLNELLLYIQRVGMSVLYTAVSFTSCRQNYRCRLGNLWVISAWVQMMPASVFCLRALEFMVLVTFDNFKDWTISSQNIFFFSYQLHHIAFDWLKSHIPCSTSQAILGPVRVDLIPEISLGNQSCRLQIVMSKHGKVK